MQESEKNKLIGVFEELKSMETKAAELYAGLLKEKLSDKESEIVESIRQDELEHIEIVRQIIALIKDDG